MEIPDYYGQLEGLEEDIGVLPFALADTPKQRRVYAKAGRELTEEELNSPGVRKMMLEDIERLESETLILQDYRDRFYMADKRVAVLSAAQKQRNVVGWLSDCSLMAGSVMLGVAVSFPESIEPRIMVATGVSSAALVVTAIILKAISR